MSSEPPLFLCFGELLVDRLPEGDRPGGAPVNVACHMTRLGSRAVPVTAVGADADGENLLEHLRGCGLDDRFTGVRGDAPTGTVDVMRDTGGEPQYTIHEDVAWDRIEVSEDLLAMASGGAGLVFGTLALRSGRNRDVFGELFDAAAGARALDVNFRPPFDDLDIVDAFAPRVELLKTNRDELFRLARHYLGEGEVKGEGAPGRDDSFDTGALASVLRSRLGIDRLVTTLGRDGAVMSDAHGLHSVPGTAVDVVDPVGAGDAFLAALLDGLYRLGQPPGVALARASRLGEFVASRVGAVPEYTGDAFG